MNLPNKNYIEDYCSICKSPLPKGSIYCRDCGPPEFQLENVDAGLSLGKTVSRIFFLVLVFAVAVAVKLEFKLDSLTQEPKSELVVTPPDEVADDKDFELVHYINVSHANMRAKPSGKSEVVGMIERGDPLKVLDKGSHWSKVQQGKVTGWVATRLLTSKVQ